MTPPISQITAQNYDMQFGTNVLGHFLFLRGFGALAHGLLEVRISLIFSATPTFSQSDIT